MNETVRIAIPVSPRAAEALSDECLAREVRGIVSALLEREETSGVFVRALLGIRAEAAEAGLTDEDVDAELAAWKSERAADRR